MNRFVPPLLAFLLVLAGCQSAPPAPKDKYYRLSPATAPAQPRPVLEGTLLVRPFYADGPYAERAMLFSQVNRPRVLEQYHYHYWTLPPSMLLQEHLRHYLAASGTARRVTDTPEGGVDALLDARILRFERVISAAGSQAAVELRVTLTRPRPARVLLDKTYTASAPLPEETPYGFALATEKALAGLYAELAQDIAASR